MGDRSITLVGFPANYNKAKLRIFMKKITGDGSIESLKQCEDGKVTVTFTGHDGVRRFLDANVTEFKFGMKTYNIEIVDRPVPKPRTTQREPEAAAQNVVLKPVDESLQQLLYKNVHYWNSLPEFDIPRGTKCALVQEISPTATLQKISLHFKSKKRANDYQSCIQKTDHMFDEKPIKIFPKLIPTFYDRKFVIKNVAENIAKDTLVLFLESCSDSEATPRDCVKQDVTGTYLVDYGPDLELAEKPSLLKEIQSRPLEGQSLLVTPLLRTDCLKLADVNDSVNNDEIKLAMESKQHTGGGPVTRIDRTKRQSVLVYFALIEDAERVYENAKKSDGAIIIDQHPIHVSLYHHSLSKDHEEVIENVKPIVKQRVAAPQRHTEQSEEPEAAAGKVVVTPVDEALQEQLYKNVHYWNSMPELRIPRGTKCALVQEISPTAKLQKIFMHFTSKKRANGGPLACVANMIDGLLVIFENDADCQSCIQKAEQTFDGKPIKIFPKVIPTSYERKFVIENVDERITLDTLQLFLESCSDSEATPRECIKQDIPGMYLVDYDKSFDLSEKPSLLKEIQSRCLEGQSLMVKPLLRTDCIKLADVKDSVTNNKIKLMMESKKRTGGGPVTRIDRTKQQSVLVYFALISDAERVYENAKKSDGVIVIDQHPIHVYLYHHSLSKDHEEVIQNVKPTVKQEAAPQQHSEQSEAPEPEPEAAAEEVAQTSADEPLQDLLYKHVHYWNSLPELHIPRGTKCALVQEISPTAKLQNIFMHFKSKKRANGGPLAYVVNMIDGLLIIFENDEDCQSCIKKTDQTFDGKPIKIFPKTIPTCYERKFVIQNVDERTTEDTLQLFLESCSDSEATPRECIKQDIPGMYILDYGSDFDLAEKPSLLKEIQSRPLEGQPLMAASLLRTDCLKLTDVKDSVTSDKIKLMMESKKRTGGGPVTRIYRTKQQSVLVYFALIEDAERVYENAKKSDGAIIIDQHPIHVSLYHHSLSKDHEEMTQKVKPAVKEEEVKEKKKKQLEAFQANPKCDQKILSFVAKTDSQRTNVVNEFVKFAHLELLEQNDKIAIKFTPQQVDSPLSQKEFEDKCLQDFEKLISDQYSVVEKSFTRSVLAEARSHKVFKEIEETYTGDDVATVRWKPGEPSVTIIGLTGVVRSIAQLIETCVQSKAVIKELPEDQYNVVVHCGVVEQMQQKSPSLHVKLDDHNFSVTLFGPENEILRAQVELLSTGMGFKKRKLNEIDEMIVKFLSDPKQKSSKLYAQIQERFKEANVRATIWYDDDNPFIRAKSSDDFENAIAIIKKTVVIKLLQLDEQQSDAFELPEWMEFKKNIQRNGPFQITVKPKDSVIVVGLKSDAENIRKEIDNYLQENALKRFFLGMQYGKAKFVVERSKEFSKERCEVLNLTCAMSAEAGGGIVLEAKNAVLKKAHDQLLKLKKSILELSHTINKSGMKEFYYGDEGKSFLTTMEKAYDCTILIDTPECEEWVKLNKEYETSRGELSEASDSSFSSPDPQGNRLIEVTLPKSSVKLSVWKTDIANHRCDVIVNASNEDMLLLPSGISGVIKKLDDKNFGRIQEEMKEIAKNHHGKVDTGEAYITSSGNLPFCKSIVHVVGPKWRSNGSSKKMNSLLLKACISKTLEVTDEEMRKSVAIPAVSCGVFGGNVNVCIPLIVEAVEEFFRDNKKSSIKEVHFVEFSQPNVLKEFVNSVKKYGVETPKPPPATVSSKKRPSFSPSSLVRIIQGDITQQKADVIVNATDPSHVRNMAAGPVVSSLLAKSAGQSVLQECRNLRGPFNLGSVHETSGGALPCKQIYHALVTHYDPSNSSNIMKSVISKCLTKADAAGHSSIVFPAIATGGFQHPPDLVAKIMNQEFMKFKGMNLRKVIILLYPGNQEVIDTFDKEFNASSKAPVRTEQKSKSEHTSYAFEEYEEKKKKVTGEFSSSFQKIDDMSGSVGSLVMSICEGDITRMKGDVIVNSTNSDFRLDQGMVSTKILKIGGHQIQAEANKNKTPGADFVVTRSGNLPSHEIIHLVTPTNPAEIHQKIIVVLKEVERRKRKSVYMPAFGTGKLGLEVDTIASIMRTSIEEFAATCNPRYLGCVSIIIFNNKILKKFQDGFFHPEKKQGILGRFIDGFKDLFYSEPIASNAKERMPHEQQQNENVLQLFFYSSSEENINKAIGDIKNETAKRTLRQTIRDDTVDRLSDWERYEIKEIASRHNVVLSRKKSRYLKELVLEGMLKDVMTAKEAIKDVIREFTGAEMCAQYVIWQFKVKPGSWEDLPLRSNNDLEKAFKSWHKGNSSQNAVNIRRFIDGKVVSEQVNLKDTEIDATDPKIRRKIREKSDLPSFWDDMQGQQICMVTLTPTSQEYQDVMQKFQASGVFHQSIKSVERVQHLALYQQYAAKKMEITNKLKGFGKPIEQQLFHGTADADKIIQHGFDRSYAGKNATVYGKGVYFAVHAKYSNGYAQPNSQGERRMFVADVITGEFCQGNSDVKAPPPKTNSKLKNDIYDSVVNNMQTPTIYVIFKDASAYPTYLITYT